MERTEGDAGIKSKGAGKRRQADSTVPRGNLVRTSSTSFHFFSKLSQLSRFRFLFYAQRPSEKVTVRVASAVVANAGSNRNPITCLILPFGHGHRKSRHLLRPVMAS